MLGKPEGMKERSLWVNYPEWYTFDKNGNAIFKPNTPKKILDSYRKYQEGR